MSRGLRAKVDAALAARGIEGELSKVDGVWYLAGPAFATVADGTCLHTCQLSTLTVEGVLAEAERMLGDAL